MIMVLAIIKNQKLILEMNKQNNYLVTKILYIGLTVLIPKMFSIMIMLFYNIGTQKKDMTYLKNSKMISLHLLMITYIQTVVWEILKEVLPGATLIKLGLEFTHFNLKMLILEIDYQDLKHHYGLKKFLIIILITVLGLELLHQL